MKKIVVISNFSPFHLANQKTGKKEKLITIHHLNHNHFGASEYEKAQRELQQFNRPIIGLVGKEGDQLSYQEYQKKILGTTY